MIPIFVINLDRSKDRLSTIQTDFDSAGLEFIRIPAVDGKLLSDDQYSFYDKDKSIEIHGRELTCLEIGASLSHLSVYEKIVNNNIPISLVCEDDARPTSHTLQFLNAIDNLPDDWEIVKLVYETCSWDDPFCKLTDTITLKQFHDSVAYAAAYLLSLDGAKKLLKCGYPIRYAPDGLTGRFVETGIRLYGTQPFCMDRSGLPSTIDCRI